MVEQLDLINADRRLFPSSFALLALRDSRYHNTAYALTELIDNSIDADAGRIELLCQERLTEVKLKQHWQLSEIAVLDNGTGMVVNTLLEALKFGGGTRHHAKRALANTGWAFRHHQCPSVKEWMYGRGRMAQLQCGTPASMPTSLRKAAALFLFLTKRRLYLRHGNARAATESLKVSQARSSCGATWTRLN